MIEQSFVIVKPDGMERSLAGEIIKRISSAGLLVTEQKDIYVTKEQAERLYWEHRDKPFYNGLVDYIMSGKVTVMKVAGESAVSVMRGLMGNTDPEKAEKGTIRADFKPDKQDGKIIKNTIHGSDSAASAKRETGIFFG
ncbi:MAG: nucleoside-diphosphate kinase [Candidatus Saganbacteria bacterium]|nr:nucleoside-diphosphate kinase [Candidatus Saganbacteria bacterium]